MLKETTGPLIRLEPTTSKKKGRHTIHEKTVEKLFAFASFADKHPTPLWLSFQGPRHGGPNADRKVFMGGLPNSADEDAIRNFFSQYGKVM